MQYLLKLTLRQSPIWRLIAIDGDYDLCLCGKLIALSFGYRGGRYEFKCQDKIFKAGSDGKSLTLGDQSRLDSLGLKLQDQGWEFKAVLDDKFELVHDIEIMRCEEHLYCLMPSTLVGAEPVAPQGEQSLQAILAYLDAHDTQGLNLKDCTTRMRSFFTGYRQDESAFAIPHC